MSNNVKRIIGYSIAVIIACGFLGGLAFMIIDSLGIIPIIVIGLLIIALYLIEDGK